MRNFNKIFVVTVFATSLFGITSCSEKDFLDSSNTANMMMTRAMATSDYYYWYKGEKVGISSLNGTLNIVPLQPKEFFGWLCKSQQDATFCLFFLLF